VEAGAGTKGPEPRSPLAAHSASPAELKAQIEAERRGVPFLVLRDAKGAQRLHPLEDGERTITIGRRESSDVSLEWDGEVSRVHAALERVGGEWTLVDDGMSVNGSFVNGERVSGRRRLRNDDAIRVGQTVIVYRDPLSGGSGPTKVSAQAVTAADLSATQRRVLLALSRPFKEGSAYALPATNQQIADELFLSVDAVKAHLRALFRKFEVGDLPQNQKRARLVEFAFQTGVVRERDL
jgi:pSer/pThr/pTyr-binding forkhead associated (FHA) protein